MEDGVWRTIGGRKVFIKKGQSVSSAMKESGKFKSGKKKALGSGIKDLDNDVEDKLKKIDETSKKAREEEFEKNIDEMYNRFHGKTDKEIAEEIAKERGERLLTDEEQKQREIDFMKNLEKEVDSKKGWTREEGGVHTKKNEDGSLNYIQGVKKGDGSHEYTRTDYDKDGNELSSKTYKSLEEAQAGKRKALGKGLNELVEDNKITEQTKGIKSLFGEDTNKNDKYNISQYGDLSKPDNYMKAQNDLVFKHNMSVAESEKILGEYKSGGYKTQEEQMREAGIKFASDEQMKELNKKADWVKDAFAKYKKDHPRTKLTLNDFKKQQK